MKHLLRDIEYFSVVAECGNVGRASVELGLSQPAVSKSLRRLESSIHAKLVQRTPKGIALTSVGATLFSQVRRLRLSLDEVTREIADLSEGRAGQLRLGSGTGSAAHIVTAACAALSEEAPRVRFRVSTLGLDETVSRLCNGDIDLAVNTIRAHRQEDLVAERLYDEQFVVYASSSHRLAGRKQVSLGELARERWVVSNSEASAPQHLAQLFINAGLPPPSAVMETDSLALRQQFVASSHAVSLASKRMVHLAAQQYALRELNVAGFTYSRSIGIYYRKNSYFSPAAQRFLSILKEVTKDCLARLAD